MQLTDFFSRLASSLFGAQSAVPGDDIDPALLDEAVEAIVEAVEPSIRLVPKYRTRLAPSAIRTIRFMRSLAGALQAPIELSPKAWNTDSQINAFFATAADIPSLLRRSETLRVFFDKSENARCDAAYCLLAMRREERNVFASALVDGELRGDVPQTTVGFTDHRLLVATGDPTTTRRLVGQAILERMAALALERIMATRELATELEVRKSVLATRLRMLTLRRGALHELTADEPDPSQEIAAIERELAAATKDHRETKASLATLNYSIEQIECVLGKPEHHIGLDRIEMRVSHTGYKLDSNAMGPGAELRLNELWIGPRIRAVITLVRVPRTAMI